MKLLCSLMETVFNKYPVPPQNASFINTLLFFVSYKVNTSNMEILALSK